MAGQLGRIVEYIDQLQQYEAGPAVQGGVGAAAPEADDLVQPCLPRASFLANAPAALDAFLLVPEVRATPGTEGRRGPEARGGTAAGSPPGHNAQPGGDE